MNPNRLLALFVLLLLLGGASGARAQFSADRPSEYQSQTGTRPPLYFKSVSVFPAAVFDVGGSFSTGSSGTQSLYGGLVDVELGTVYTRTKTTYQIGGWYWGRAGNDLYEVHARVQSSRGLGLQVGYLNTSQGFTLVPGPTSTTGQSQKHDAEAYDVFVVYTLTSGSIKRGRVSDNHPFSLEFGLGAYIDASLHQIGSGSLARSSAKATGNYTFYVGGAYHFGPSWSLLLSEWTIRDRQQELNRVALGVGFGF